MRIAQRIDSINTRGEAKARITPLGRSHASSVVCNCLSSKHTDIKITFGYCEGKGKNRVWIGLESDNAEVVAALQELEP